MPTYEYRCPEGHDSEDFVLKISAAKDSIPCPVCGAVAARRVSAGSGLLFKGSGFYITDYGKDGKKDQPKPAASTKPVGGSSTSTPASAPAAAAAAPAAAPSSSGPSKPSTGSSSSGSQ
jgi:putative FmdB family regulatory protein